ncbi:PRD domain protein [Lacticaseibacillus paracasei]|uniref:PRD domain-containing protein n=1 Tax=Lacticaseibacillus paracasei TaxID=1597 RepID=UPI000F0B999B|nr:PRD domain-containing protein [Lacticaseibacillus paracasei]RND87045.1 PRD domain protein [Lacticaseibacillus paracasei]
MIERQAGQVTEVHDADDIGKSLSATLASMYPKAYTTATAIREMLQERKHWQLDQNEIVYLVIHIERLVSHAKQS